MIIQLVDGLFAITGLLLIVLAFSYATIFTFVAVDAWGIRHRQQSLAREADRAIRRDQRQRDQERRSREDTDAD